uniref:Uncharacterized protein n=1 Tax=Rhizophora mucronata TaxID=61149 RepID=A0A2P2QTK3_RHIMU
MFLNLEIVSFLHHCSFMLCILQVSTFPLDMVILCNKYAALFIYFWVRTCTYIQTNKHIQKQA